MKKAILIFAVLLTISSCKFSQQAQTFYNDKCPDSYAKKNTDGTFTFFIKCSNIYETAKIREYLKEGNISYDIVNGEVTGKITSSDSIPNLYAILKGVSKGIKK